MIKKTVTEARALLPELLSRVSEGEEVVLTRHGQPVAVLVRPDVLRARRASAVDEAARDLHELLETARAAPIPRKRGLTARRANQLIAAVEAGRAAR